MNDLRESQERESCMDSPVDQNELNEQLYFNRISDLDSDWLHDSIFQSNDLDKLVTSILNEDTEQTGKLMIEMARDCAFPKG